MSTATTQPAAPSPLEMPVPLVRMPSLDELRRLTEVPDRRVVYRGADWAFYETLVASIPERSNIHVDYDGRDLELMAKGRRHERFNRRLDLLVGIVADEWDIRFTGLGETTWKREGVSRGLEADHAYYFQAEKLARDAEAAARDSDEIEDYPNPDLAIEVDISRPQVDREGIYAALRVAEVWRFEEGGVVIGRLTPAGRYEAVDASGFLPIRADDVRRLVLGGPAIEGDWKRWVREEVRRLRAG